jgi:hypothetical protein
LNVKENTSLAVVDIKGRKFGHLTVIDRDGSTKEGRATWLVKCSCNGLAFSVIGKDLVSGNTKSCGCLRKLKAVDLIGHRIGCLTVLRRDGSNSAGDATWWVQCSCGSAEKSILSKHLRNGNTKSCGCVRKQDLTQMRFTRLLVLRRNGADKHGNAIWYVQCDCGSPEFSVVGYSLISGNTKSCGCLKLELSRLINVNDLTGRRFGRLIVLRRDGMRGHKSAWLVQCDCGSHQSSPQNQNAFFVACIVLEEEFTKLFALSNVVVPNPTSLHPSLQIVNAIRKLD